MKSKTEAFGENYNGEESFLMSASLQQQNSALEAQLTFLCESIH